MPKVTIDGKAIECKDRQTILQVALDAGIEIPYYCYHPGLSIAASCRICLVEVEGIPKLVPACQTVVRDGMVVNFTTPKAVANQKAVMEFLLVNHPLDCPICDQAGECGLQDYSYEFGRAQSRFEEDKHKKPKKDLGKHVLLYNHRCIMCSRCVRFTREVSGTCELLVEGRGHKEEIDIFPGQPLDNPLSGNVVDICPVGALLDKEFLFRQRVWFLKSTPSISPVDEGGENIYLDHNQGKVYRIKPRFNDRVNQWWISDDTRYCWKVLEDPRRLIEPRRNQYNTQAPASWEKALEQARVLLAALVAEKGPGSLYAVLSPMMACEEAWLLGQLIRRLDPQALLVGGPVPSAEHDQVFRHYQSGKQTFVIKARKVPNAAGIGRVMQMLGGPSATWEGFVEGSAAEVKKAQGGWIVGGYLAPWLAREQPGQFKKGLRIVQDILPNALVEAADIVLPAAVWAEKDGCWENYQGIIQPFSAAVAPPKGVRCEGDVYLQLLGRDQRYDARSIRLEMGGVFAEAGKVEDRPVSEPAFEFTEL